MRRSLVLGLPLQLVFSVLLSFVMLIVMLGPYLFAGKANWKGDISTIYRLFKPAGFKNAENV
jgi:hypothetical protein